MQIINRIWPEWKVEKEIGQGSYGTVYKCVNEAKEYCAIKVISIPQNEHEMSEVISEKMSVEQSREYYKDIADDLIKEIEILKALKGTKNIVEIYDAQIIEKEDGIGWNILIRMELLTDFNTYISDKQLGEKDEFKAYRFFTTDHDVMYAETDVLVTDSYINPIGYKFYDINNDGIEELIVHEKIHIKEFKIFTFKDGEMLCAGVIDDDHGSLYVRDDTITAVTREWVDYETEDAEPYSMYSIYKLSDDKIAEIGHGSCVPINELGDSQFGKKLIFTEWQEV